MEGCARKKLCWLVTNNGPLITDLGWFRGGGVHNLISEGGNHTSDSSGGGGVKDTGTRNTSEIIGCGV